MTAADALAVVDGRDAVEATGAERDHERGLELGGDVEVADLDLEGVGHEIAVLVLAGAEDRLGLAVGLPAEEAPALGLTLLRRERDSALHKRWRADESSEINGWLADR